MKIQNFTKKSDDEIKTLTFSRYIKISAFLDLLHGKALVPTFETLRKSEPQELGIPAHSHMGLAREMFAKSEFKQAESWLEKRWENRFETDFCQVGDVRDELLMSECLLELGQRRCTWCWYYSPDGAEESVAMWNLYAKEGVLIKTTFERIERAITSRARYEAGLFKVDYVRVGQHDTKFASAENLRRPFLFKSDGYRHEREMRLVFQNQGKPLHPGIRLSVDPKVLIMKLLFSPYLSKHEFTALKRLAERRLKGIVIKHALRELDEEIPDLFDDRSSRDVPTVLKTL